MALEVRRYGASGPKVVVLHGGPGARGSARGLARILESHFSVLEPLQRRAGDAPLTVERHVEDLAEVAPRAAVVGWSWGAMLGLSYAARYPDRVTALALVGCGTYAECDRQLYRVRLEAALGAEGRAQRDALQGAIASARDPAERDRLLAELGSLHAVANGFELIDADPEDLVDIDARGNQETWSDVLRLQEEGQEPAAFAAIRMPVLMLHGEDDPHPGEATCATLRRFLPQLEYVAFPRCGHEPWRERHAHVEFERVLRQWLLRHA